MLEGPAVQRSWDRGEQQAASGGHRECADSGERWGWGGSQGPDHSGAALLHSEEFGTYPEDGEEKWNIF